MKSQTKPPEFLLVVLLIAACAGAVAGVAQAIWGEWPAPIRDLFFWILCGLVLKLWDTTWTWPRTAGFVVACFIVQRVALLLELAFRRRFLDEAQAEKIAAADARAAAEWGLSRVAPSSAPLQGEDWLVLILVGGGALVLCVWAAKETAKALNHLFRR